MRKLFFILLFIPTIVFGKYPEINVLRLLSNLHPVMEIDYFASNYYVAPVSLGGSDSNDGSMATPWLTLSHATSVAVDGDNIYVLADITDNNYCEVDVNVDIQGYNGTIQITTSYANTGTQYAYLRYHSNVLTNGNQKLSYIHLNGNNRTAYRAIDVYHRNHVEISNCYIEDFEYSGVHFDNEISWIQEPTVYADGNSFHDSEIWNCSDRVDGRDEQGCLRFDGQTGFLCYSNIFNQTERSSGHNGTILDWSFVKDAKVYSNNFYKNDSETGIWNFCAELWNTQGGCEVYSNTTYGAASWDFGGPSNIKDEYAFCLKYYSNKHYANNYPITRPSHDATGLVIEGGNEYFYVYHNLWDGYAISIEVATSTLSTNYVMDNIYIYSNIIKNFNYSDYPYTYGILLISEGNGAFSNTWTNIHLWNNDIFGGDYYNRWGIYWNVNGTVSTCSIKNNIIHSCDYYAVNFTKQVTDPDACILTDVDVMYNDFYNNGVNGVSQGGSITYNSCDMTTGNITTNPQWVTYSDFRLQSTSPCIATGTSVSFPYGGTVDYIGTTYGGTPSMGAYEYKIPIDPPIIQYLPLRLLEHINKALKHLNKGLKLTPVNPG